MSDKPLILVVDDQNDFQEIVTAKLEASGFAVAHAKNRDQAIEQAGKQKPSLILLDINMPGVQGSEVLLELKQNEATRAIPVAFLTSMKDPWPGFRGDPAQVARELGAVAFFQKTDELDALVQSIRGLIAGHP